MPIAHVRTDYQRITGNNTQTVSFAAHAAGTVLVGWLHQFKFGIATPEPSTPAGWTKQITCPSASTSGDGLPSRATLYTKTSDGTETSFTTTTPSDNPVGYVGVSGYSGVRAIGASAAATATETSHVGSVVLPAVTVTGTDGIVFGLWAGGSGAASTSSTFWTPPSGWTERADDSGQNSMAGVGDVAYSGSPGTAGGGTAVGSIDLNGAGYNGATLLLVGNFGTYVPAIML